MLDEDFEDISISLKDAKTGDFDNLLDSHRLIVNDPLLSLRLKKNCRIIDQRRMCPSKTLNYIVEQFSKNI